MAAIVPLPVSLVLIVIPLTPAVIYTPADLSNG